MQLRHLSNNRRILQPKSSPRNDVFDILPLFHEPKLLVESNSTYNIKCIPLEPLSQIDDFVERSELVHGRDENVSTGIHLRLERLKIGERVFLGNCGPEGFVLHGIGGREHVLHVLSLVLHCEEIINLRLYR
jgi:hypothetical protein